METVQPYLPHIQGTTAMDVANLFLAGEKLKSMKIQNMMAEDGVAMQDIASGAWMEGQGNKLANPQRQDAPQQPQQAPPEQRPQQNMLAPTQQGGMSATLDEGNKIAEFKPAASPSEITAMFKHDTKDPEKEAEKGMFTDKKYQVQVPGRPTTEYLQEKVREGKIHPRAAYLFDMGTQQLRQKEEAKLMQQSAEYGELQKSSYMDAINSGDMKRVKTLLEQAKIDLPNNPIVQRNSDFMIKKIDSGEIIKIGKTEKEPVNNDVLIRKQYEEDLKANPDNKGRSQTWIAAEAAKRVEAEQDERKAKQQKTVIELRQDAKPEKEPREPKTDFDMTVADYKSQIAKDHKVWSPEKVAHEAAKAARQEIAGAKVDYAGKVAEMRSSAKQKNDDAKFAKIDEPLPKALEVVAQSIATKGELPKDFMSMRDPNALRVIARAKTINPDLDLAKEDINRKLAQSPSFEKTAFIARSIIPNIDEFVKTVEPLEFSDVKVVGQVEEFFKGNMSKSVLTAAAARRADLMMNIAQVSKGTGATDQTIQQEASVLNHAASSEEIHAWAKAQKQALEPIVEQYTEVNKIKTGERRKELDQKNKGDIEEPRPLSTGAKEESKPSLEEYKKHWKGKGYSDEQLFQAWKLL